MSISIEQAKDELTQLLAKNKLCIFAGSGISVPAPSNLPTWDQFVDKYIEICGEVNKVVDSTMKFGDILADAPSYKTKSAVNTLTVLKDKIRLCKKHGMSTSIYDDMMNELFSGREPNDYHETIVNTDYKYILTTNYDTLLDKAAMRQKHYDLVRRIYSYKDLQKISEAVYTVEDKPLPVESPEPMLPALPGNGWMPSVTLSDVHWDGSSHQLTMLFAYDGTDNMPHHGELVYDADTDVVLSAIEATPMTRLEGAD